MALPQPVRSDPMKDEEEEECEDEEMEENPAEDGEETRQKAKQAITCRSVTLNTLMADGVISHGKGVLSIDYLGQRFEADLLESGKIKWHGSHEEFGTPSAWALHCKRLVNPIKRSGCGWASVKYKNRKLDIWKSMWARKHRIMTPFKSPHQATAMALSPGSAPTTSPTSCTPSLTPLGFLLSPTESSSAPPPTTTLTTTVTSDVALLSPPLTSPTTLTSQPPESLDSSPEKELKAENLMALPVTQINLTSPPLKLASPSANQTSSANLISLSANLTSASASLTSPSVSLTSQPSISASKVLSLSKTAYLLQDEVTPLNLTTVTTASPLPKSDTSAALLASIRRGKTRLEESCMARERKSVAYSTLGTRGLETDLLTLVKCEHFDQHSKIQPFTVSITSNTLLLMDFHCHLTKSEVVGYLGGRWDSLSQHLSIEQAYPVRCRLGDKERAPLVEEEIRRVMRHKNQMVVGWYHSHPYCQPDPTIRDVDCQMSYQLKMRGSGSMYLPCLGFIVSPFEKLPPKPDSKIQAFWVMPNLEHPASYNIPMHVTYSVARDSSLTEDLLTDMKQLIEFYRMAIDKVQVKEHWGEAITYKDKIKASLRSKLPEDQLDSSTFLDYVQQLLFDLR